MNKLPDDEFTQEDAANLIRDYRVPLQPDRLDALTEKLQARANELSKDSVHDTPSQDAEKDLERD